MKIKSMAMALSLFTGVTAYAQLQAGACTNAQTSKVATTHTITLNGNVINYVATVGYLEVTAADGASKACVFYTSYVAQPATEARPITFAFNGGPGSASLFLHLGFLGPKRVDMGAKGLNPPLNLSLIDNAYSPLDVTDIVMIDPVATGFSQTEAGASTDKFFGVKNDYKSIASFVQNYLSEANRWLSPKFIMGESYGGIRGTLLVQELQSNDGIGIDGLILVSPALSWTSLDFTVADNNVPYWAFFPNFATNAWFHQRANPKYQTLTNVDEVYEQARTFANTTLRDALDAGDDLSAQDSDSIAQTITDFTGIPKQTINNLNLRMADTDFFGDLLSSTNQVIGRYDGRFVAPMTSHQPGQDGWIDPSDNETGYQFTAGINDYLRTDLNFQTVSPYTASANITSWPFDSDGDSFSVVEQLGSDLANNPNLKVLINSGYYDLACPMATVEYELSQVPGGEPIRSRITQMRYEGGHMMYINPDALAVLKTNVANFITQQSATVQAAPAQPAPHVLPL